MPGDLHLAIFMLLSSVSALCQKEQRRVLYAVPACLIGMTRSVEVEVANRLLVNYKGVLFTI
jgi:hypothetical protein